MTTTRDPRSPRGSSRAHPETEESDSPKRSGSSAAIGVVQKVFGAETGTFFLLLGTTLFLVAFGLVMVLSSSSIEDGASAGHDFFSSFTRQGLYALIGVPLLLIASRMPIGFWKKWAWPAVVGTSVLQLLVFVPGIGYAFQGNSNWIRIGSFTAQPSELVKLALILWVSWILARKRSLLDDWKHVFLPIAPVAGVAIGFVLLGRDLGTALIMGMVVLGCLFYAGVRLRIVGVAVVVSGLIALIFSQIGSSRSSRIGAFLSGCTNAADYKDRGEQFAKAVREALEGTTDDDDPGSAEPAR